MKTSCSYRSYKELQQKYLWESVHNEFKWTIRYNSILFWDISISVLSVQFKTFYPPLLHVALDVAFLAFPEEHSINFLKICWPLTQVFVSHFRRFFCHYFFAIVQFVYINHISHWYLHFYLFHFWSFHSSDFFCFFKQHYKAYSRK